ncbi:putative membrane protein [Rhizobium sp. PP-F2F-G38]|uniref:DMT family transporter n=1 Tax=Rhizobium sp. PP-CC-3G-465 TaxID=2135648 RepID=UPI000D845FA5|nr:putative membrane protein [Rhizobium sp. PP-F2F-G20b]PYE93334.1 putative membrane protein [Rhizobium sp. PP-F2F-G38]TCP75609.1 putative membrane protein [Rhizobium sp. PP-CC-2G-626]TCQ17243.1 putative membrane protein [Rhizobium sp. PP-CC-3G-465]
MRRRDFILLMLVCLVWAINVIVGKVVLSGMGVPPFYYAAIRFLLVAVLLSKLLLPIPRQIGRILLAGLFMGAGHFGFLFLGLTSSSPSAASIVLQFGIPITTILSVCFLGEKLSSFRAVGILLALCGVIVVIWDPSGFSLSPGLFAILISTTSLASGAVLLKRIDAIAPLRLQAWVGFVSFLPLSLASVFLEHGQMASTLAGGWTIATAIVFSAIVVTGWAHTTYFSLLQRYEANLVVPLTLAMPLMTMVLGVAFTGDKIDARIVTGTIIAIAGIWIVISAKPRRHIVT